METKRPKAIALMSGGLDSTLAAKIVADQGVEVLGLHLLSPFGCRSSVQKNADAAGVRRKTYVQYETVTVGSAVHSRKKVVLYRPSWNMTSNYSRYGVR